MAVQSEAHEAVGALLRANAEVNVQAQNGDVALGLYTDILRRINCPSGVGGGQAETVSAAVCPLCRYARNSTDSRIDSSSLTMDSVHPFGARANVNPITSPYRFRR
jgi:hypothetical protein